MLFNLDGSGNWNLPLPFSPSQSSDRINNRIIKIVGSHSIIRSRAIPFYSMALSLILLLHNSGCTYVSPKRASLDNLAAKEITALAQDPDSACRAALSDIEGCPDNLRCPDVVYTAARCHLEGLGGTTIDAIKGMELLTFAAGCGLIPAKDELTKHGLPIPDQIISYGYKILPPSTKEQKMCGVRDSATALSLGGIVVAAPFLFAAGVVLLGAVIVVAPPYCAARWLITDGTCLDHFPANPTDEK